jgi:putative transposase
VLVAADLVGPRQEAGLNRRPGPPVHDDLVERDFTAPAANVLWLTDITEHRTGEGKLYLCAIKDAFSNRIVGYSMDAGCRQLAVAALNNALMTRGPASTSSTATGARNFAPRFCKGPGRAELRGSMGRVATCADNAAMESFFSLLQKNVLDTKRWATGRNSV